MRLREKCRGELEKLKSVLREIEIKDESLRELIFSYASDAEHFFEKGEVLKAFELCSYVWGMLDAGARLRKIDPKRARRYFKI